MSSSKLTLKQHFSVVNSIKPFFTSLKLNIDQSEKYFILYSNEKINFYSIEKGQIIHSFPDDESLEEDKINNFSTSNDHIVIVFKSGLLRLYKWSIDQEFDTVNINLIKTWRSQHKGPISLIEFDSNNGNLIATGSSDGSVIIWDLVGQYITHFLKGCTGVITTIAFQKNSTEEQYLFCASGNHDNKLFVWNLKSSSTNKLIAKFEKHSSEITGAEFFFDCENKLKLLSVSRDKIACVYDLDSLSVQRTIPIYNSVSSMLILPLNSFLEDEDKKSNDNYFITVGEKNTVDFWSIKTGRKMLSKLISDNLIQIKYLRKTNQLCIVTYEKNVLIYQLKFHSINLIKQLSGNNEEVLDLCYLGEKQDYLVVATNSPNLKIFQLANFNCLIVEIHQEVVISVKSFSTEPYLFVSCSKDKSFKLWKFNLDEWKLECLFVGLGHNGTVNAMGLPNLTKNWIITGSEDNTIKIWLLPDIHSTNKDNENEEIVIKKLISQTTLKAHDKGVNCIDVSPNDRLIVTCSNDKLAKLFKFNFLDQNIQTCSLEQLGTFSGHRRGIWSVRFSPIDQILATSSSDSTIKLWSLKDFSCLRTFEGHKNSVLEISFLTNGMQLLSSCSDGNLKLWNVKNAECLNTIDAHADKISCFLINKEEDQLITGSSDSEINIWKDITEERTEKEKQKTEQIHRKSEILRNLILERKWKKAIKLSISLNQPFTSLTIFKEIDLEYNLEDRDKILNQLFEKLREDQLNSLLDYTSKWNTNQKHAYIAQLVLKNLIKKLIYSYNCDREDSKSFDNLSNQDNLKQLIQKLEPYTRKHYERYSKVFQSVTFFEFLYDNMKLSVQSES